MLKALQKHLEITGGRGAVDAWLTATRTERRDLEDESRAIPIPRLLGALRAFVEIAGPGAIDRAATHLLLPDNLGAWTRILRGSTEPIEAFDRLDASDTDLSRTIRWETLSRSPTAWSGRVHLAHDPSLESDGLLRAARMAELSMVPALFGLGRGEVSSIEALTQKGHAQEFEVRWRVPTTGPAVLTGLLIGSAAGAVPLVATPSALGAVWLALASSAGVLSALVATRDRARRIESVAQRTRVYALERSLLLRDAVQVAQTGTLEGTVVAGQYRIVRRMGSGGSGVIYEAHRASDGLPVAIKLLRTVAAHDAVASDRLRREAEALGLAWHPNVVDVLDHGHLADGTSYLVMELLRGESLAVHLESKRRLTPEELQPIAVQVCDALIAVHAAGVVHRDLKPSNIFLTPAAPPSTEVRVKLIDFGIARVEWEETRITNIGAPVGTPGYMSPEQEAGADVDGRSDVFAFGQVMYECLLGRPPATGRTRPSEPPSSLAKPEPSRPGSREDLAARVLTPGWTAFLTQAMALEPADRFPDARTMAAAIRGLATVAPLASAGAGAAEPAGNTGPRSGDAPGPAKIAGVS
jgi:hypothetical protein